LGFSLSYEEAYRRMLVALTRRAGTLIRKEELIRQALTASINRPLAEVLLKEIDEILKLAPDFEQATKDAVEGALKEGKPILETVLEDIINGFIKALPLAFAGTLDRMKRVITKTNEVINTANKIIEELSKEGFYLPKIETIEIRDDIISLTQALKIAKQRLQTIIEFFKELEKYSEEV